MSVVSACVLLVLAAFLVVSAAAKASSPSAAIAALVELGLPYRAACVTVAAGVAAEAVVAAAIVLWPHAPAAQTACLLLFGAFALVAALALQEGRAIECGCMGSIHRSTLGWTQIMSFGLVVPSVIVIGRFAPVWSIETGLVVLFVVQVVAGVLLLAYAFPLAWKVRRDRISLSSVRDYVQRAGWPEIPVVEGEGRPD